MIIGFTLRKHIARWQHDGLIDEATAERLRKDIAGQGFSFGLGNVLAILGAILLGTALLSLIAANWEAMPRLVRVGLIFVVLWGGYLGGAWRASRGDKVFSEALYLIAAIGFGAGIALIGQMYHLSGDVTSAALLWTGGTVVAALLLRSPALVAASVVITAFYLVASLEPETAWRLSYLWIVPILAVVVAGLIWYTKADVARHFLAVLLLVFVAVVHFDLSSSGMVWLALVVGLGLFLVDALKSPMLDRVTGWSIALGAYGFLAAHLALMLFQFDDHVIGHSREVVIGFAILVLAIAGLALSGHRNLAVRWSAYGVFCVEVLYLAFETIGSLIGTAGFFLTVGVLVLLLAVFVIRMERRLQKKSLLKEVEP
ncbi:DUF2157 domain-containing protein [Phyllobacterium myrsinacearum]|uniref:Putative membrane protein n=1 Tax=Phyllobacterium myrsinacearum TaxID=28101 RepID=A0A839EK26_9HYPH|nr:DUF2157 domain-containing protein [Phyllobacterium myrsinacearum]MBA8880773.1 putative membrane protein [Phyllobacterium myrsinacearum]